MFSSGIGADRKTRLETAQNKILMSIRPDTKGAFLSKVEVRSEISRLFFSERAVACHSSQITNGIQ